MAPTPNHGNRELLQFEEWLKKSTANITFNEKLRAFSLRARTRQGCLMSLLLVNITLQVQANAVKIKKEIKSRRTEKKRLPELINNYSKVAGYKVNLQKLIISIYHQQIEFEILKEKNTIYISTQDN